MEIKTHPLANISVLGTPIEIVDGVSAVVELMTDDAMAVLEGYGLIHPVTKLPPTKDRKKGPVMWGFFNSTERQVQDAVLLYNRLTQPMYLKAENLAMDFLEHVVIKEGLSEVRYAQIVQYLKEKRVRSADLRFFGELAMNTLKEHDVVVWREK